MKQIKEMIIKTYLSYGGVDIEKRYFDNKGREYLRIKRDRAVSDLQYVDLGTIIDRAKKVTIVTNLSGKPLFVQDKNDNVITSYEYDELGNCIKLIDKNFSMQFMYDIENNLVCKKMSSGHEDYHLYSNNKKIFTIQKLNDIITNNIEYKYDDKGKCIKEINNSFLYDDNNNSTIKTYCKYIKYNNNNDITEVFIDDKIYEEYEYIYDEPTEPVKLSDEIFKSIIE